MEAEIYHGIAMASDDIFQLLIKDFFLFGMFRVAIYRLDNAKMVADDKSALCRVMKIRLAQVGGAVAVNFLHIFVKQSDGIIEQKRIAVIARVRHIISADSLCYQAGIKRCFSVVKQRIAEKAGAPVCRSFFEIFITVCGKIPFKKLNLLFKMVSHKNILRLR